MAKYVTYKCTKCDENKFNSAQVIAADDVERIVRCEGCGHEEKQIKPKSEKKSLRYPYFNDSLNTRVTCKDHENHVASQQGAVKVQDWNG